MPYLRKSATYHDDPNLYPPEFKKLGSDGPIPISHAELVDEMKDFRDLLTKAWKSQGHSLVENIYDGEMSGLTHCCGSIYRGERSGSWLFVKDRRNVTIMAQVHSKCLIIDETDLSCKGVTVLDSTAKERKLYADREVILSQGVFESPKLLMLSGIGPSREFSKHGINTLVDSRHVGQNLSTTRESRLSPKLRTATEWMTIACTGALSIPQALRPIGRVAKALWALDCLRWLAFHVSTNILKRTRIMSKPRKPTVEKTPFRHMDNHFQLDFVCMFGSAFQCPYPTPRKGQHVCVVVDLVRPISDPGEVTLRSANPLNSPTST